MRSMITRALWVPLACGLVAVGCSDDSGDAPVDASAGADTGTSDGGRVDAGAMDAGARDSGPADAGQLDGNVETMDASEGVDAFVADSGEMDAGPPDAGAPDAGPVLSCAGRVAMWDFEEGTGTTVVDGSGNGHDLTLSGATWTTGTVGTGAANFAASAAHGSATGHADFNATRALTITAWIQPTRVSGVQGLVARGARSGAVQDWGLYLNGTELSVLFNWPSSADTLHDSSGAAIATGTWAFVAMVLDVDAGTISFYKDGTFLSSQPWTTPLVDSLAPVSIATDSGSPNDYQGDLDAITVWTRALDATEIALVHADSTACVAP